MTEGRTITTTEFRARCLALVDEVQASGEEIVVTRRGKPVARLVPARDGRPALDMRVTWYSPDFEAPLDEPWFAWLDDS